LAAAKAYADSIDTAAVVIVDDGVIISQKGETATKFKVAVADGEIKLDASREFYAFN
jgi:hypothetical protein